MATYKKLELCLAALGELGVLDGQSTQGNPSPDDEKLAEQVRQQEMEYLYDQGLIPFDIDTDEIPARFFSPLKMIIAEALILPFGVISRSQFIEAKAEKAMQKLSRLKNHRYMGTPVQTEYF